jgi:RNA-binding protein with serine-rich domain 1
MSRGRSLSPRSVDMDVDIPPADRLDARVVIITNLTRNVVESHLKTIFGFYGHITKIDLPTFVKCEFVRSVVVIESTTYKYSK